ETTRERMGGIGYEVQEAAVVAIRHYGGRQYLVVKPTVKVLGPGEEPAPLEVDREVKRRSCSGGSSRVRRSLTLPFAAVAGYGRPAPTWNRRSSTRWRLSKRRYRATWNTCHPASDGYSPRWRKAGTTSRPTRFRKPRRMTARPSP